MCLSVYLQVSCSSRRTHFWFSSGRRSTIKPSRCPRQNCALLSWRPISLCMLSKWACSCFMASHQHHPTCSCMRCYPAISSSCSFRLQPPLASSCTEGVCSSCCDDSPSRAVAGRKSCGRCGSVKLVWPKCHVVRPGSYLFLLSKEYVFRIKVFKKNMRLIYVEEKASLVWIHTRVLIDRQ